MTRFLTLTAAAAFALASSAALAAPQIPTWANPYPAEPVATDGSPLPAQHVGQGWTASTVERVLSGRSAVAGHVSRH